VNLILTKDALYLLSYVGLIPKIHYEQFHPNIAERNSGNKNQIHLDSLERETGLEPATLSLEG
jgi:hypothetical protein